MDEAPAEEGWEIKELKDYFKDAQRAGKVYNIPEEKKQVLAILDKELAKGNGDAGQNAEADRKLDATLGWLRKRQTDTIALENRQMCRLWDVDYLAEEMETLGTNS